MKILKLFNSRVARERERESSLSSLSLKKSFTLIELSIVLLILSLLVGSLLVGRQIVDRAKIQRIIFEFDYYEKAFHQFYDTYRVVPGNVSAETCKKHAEFRKYNTCPDSCPANLPKKLMCGWCKNASNQKSYVLLSGLIEDKYKFKSEGFASNSYDYLNYYKHSIVGCQGGILSNGVWLNNPAYEFVASFMPNAFFYFTGFKFDKMIASGLSLKEYERLAFPSSNIFFNRTLPHELDNGIFRKQLDDHNAMVFFYIRQESVGGNYNRGAANVEENTTFGLLSAKLMSQLDSKIDDGRPGTGTLLAMKGGFAHRSRSNENEHKKVCYDQMADNVDKAIYESSTDLKYGCNIIKVMEDVK